MQCTHFANCKSMNMLRPENVMLSFSIKSCTASRSTKASTVEQPSRNFEYAKSSKKILNLPDTVGPLNNGSKNMRCASTFPKSDSTCSAPSPPFHSFNGQRTFLWISEDTFYTRVAFFLFHFEAAIF